MEQDRQIRFAIPPFFLFASLLWGAYLGGKDLAAIFSSKTTEEVVGLLAATTVTLVPIGFVISTLSINLMRLVFRWSGKPTYEAVIDFATLSAIWNQLQLPGDADASKTLYVIATFDHEYLSHGSPGVHLWLFRRWTSVNLAMHSSMAVVLAHAVAPLFLVPQTCAWGMSTVALVALFGASGKTAWSEVMEMIQFQAKRNTPCKPVESAGLAVSTK